MPSTVNVAASSPSHDGDGISSTWSITPVVQRSPTYPSNSRHEPNWNGSPAVGSCWNIIARLLA